MITLTAGQLSPSISDTISLGGSPFDLSGSTVSFKMRPAGSSTITVNQNALITDAVNGAVRYDWNSGDTNTAGMYAFWWVVHLPNGDDMDTPESDLQLTQHAVASNALCTIQDVHLAMEIPTTDTSLDEQIVEYINEASDAIIKATRREFAPVSTNTTRRFAISTSGIVNLMPFDLQTVTTVMLSPEQNQQTIGVGDYLLYPIVNRENVYTALRISPWIPITSQLSLKFGKGYCDITGTWGFPSVPESVKRAAVITVRTWLRRDAQAMAGNIGGSYYNGQELPAQLPATYALPAAARKLLAPYQRTIGAY